MPRYRFAWTNFRGGLLKALAVSGGLEGEPAEALRRRYGARPKPAFIQDMWPTLLDAWLPTDHDSRSALAEALREFRLGQLDIDIRGKQGQLDYLRTCRNAPRLREVTLSVFLAAGERPQGATGTEKVRVPPVRQVAEVSTANSAQGPDSPQRRSPSGEQQTSTSGSDDLNAWVEAVLCKTQGWDEVKRDAEGDIPIPRGSAVMFVRQHDGRSPFLEVFAPLLRGFHMSPEVYEAVNAINASVAMAKAMVVGNGQTILLSAEVPVATLSSSEFMFALDLVSNAADHFDTMLQKRFGGQTLLKDDYSDSTDV
jgi:hypothetical protein